jgi:integrase
MKAKFFAGIYRMPGSRFLWYRWTEAGKRYSVSLKTESEAEALIKKQEIVRDVAKRGSAPYGKQKGEPAPANQIAKIIREYLAEAMSRDRKPMTAGTAKTVGYELNLFAKESNIDSLRDLQPESMQQWLKSKKKTKSTETIRSYTRDLKAFCKYLVDQNLVHELPELSMPDAAPVGRGNYLEQEEVDAVIAAVQPVHPPKAKPETIKRAQQDADDLRFILQCGFNAGLRRKEISEARTDWFDLNKGLLHVFSNHSFTTKDKEGRTIPLKKSFLEFLKTYLVGKTGYVLAPNKVKGKGAYRFDANRRVRSHFGTCKVRCTWHDMRRSFASNLVSKGESIYIVAKWLGDGVAVVERSYGHVAPAAGNIDR